MWGGNDTYKQIFFIVALFGLLSVSALGQRVSGNLGRPNGTITTVCINESTNPSVQACNEPTLFFDDNTPRADGWIWNFGDPNSGVNNNSTLQNPRHLFTKTGTYNVTLTRQIGTAFELPPKQIPIQVRRYSPTSKPLFNRKEKADTTVCSGTTVRLDPFNALQDNFAPANVSYLWSPKGQTTPTIDVDKSGCYSVEVTDNITGCKKMARINVKFCLESAPSADKTEKWYVGDKAAFSVQPTIVPKQRDITLKEGDLFKDEFETTDYTIKSETGNPMSSVQSQAMIFNPKGEIAFTTDGKSIYNSQGNVIGTINSGSLTSTTPALIMPKYSCNECPHVNYYVLSYDATAKSLNYSVIDTRLNNGDGGVTEKDIPLANNLTERIAYTYAADQGGMWVITHEAGNNRFRVMKIDSNGFSSEQTFAGGLVHDTPESQSGYMKVSLRGNKLAVAVVKNGQNYVDIFDFDKATGRITFVKTINVGIPAPPKVFGVEISPSEDLVYVTLNGDGTTQSRLYQINITTEAKNLIYSTNDILGDMRIAPIGDIEQIGVNVLDLKLVVSVKDSDKMVFLDHPDSEGGKDFVGLNNGNTEGAPLGGKMGLGLTNVVKSKSDNQDDGIQVTYAGNCVGTDVIFTLKPVCSPMKTKAVWDFGDGSAPQEGTTVTHKYAKDGKYKITVSITISEDVVKQNLGQISQIINKVFRDECRTEQFTDDMYILPGPTLNLPKEVFVCTNLQESKILDANPRNEPNLDYLWKFGATEETTRTFLVDAPFKGASIRVQNQYDCETKHDFDIVDKCEPLVLVPEAFTPNGDVIHDSFKIDARFITDYELTIFNRWGEIVYYTQQKDSYWDGTYKNKGKDAQKFGPESFAYVIKFRSQDFPERGIESKRGAVMVLK
ncbi:MAG: PKD domain-containing protein [Spirosomaceae bacterium]|nr:PKD domain-containing protein [Spirosomataceae bacterium]